MNAYKTTVGLEVHAELKTKSKMFCGCKNDPHASKPNANICPVCMAHPGTLPVVNKEAVHFLMQVGTAIGGTLADYSEFDRKNYFYPDIPKAYQISQFAFPFVAGGELGGIAITRIHLEEDTARSQHEDGASLVDFNRAGVPLMELVTEPVIHDPESAGAFARELQLLLRTLGVSDANMEKGEMRVEVNVSVSKTDELGTKVEVKNINSFKAAEAAVAFEVKRHMEVLEAGGTLIQETRGWDENRSSTFSQRIKESADDYRYFPDPDIPKFKRSEIPEFSNARLAEILAETPDSKRSSYRDLGLAGDQIEIIISDLGRDAFFSKAAKSLADAKDITTLGNYFTSDLLGLCDAENLNLADGSSNTFAQLVGLVGKGDLNSRVAKDLLKEVVFESKDPMKLAEEKGLLQKSSADDLLPFIQQVIVENSAVVDEYKAGKDSAIQFLIGQGMKLTKGAANPGVLKSLFEKELPR
ncbi:MAG: aspartyl-tRNA(Asn)/glutamyl-tRNA(Gln) amidotransferase subunit B [Patiriisocius sp.]|jgi:aspartyl-tRNA(Asn)/glutamyl-tRNA(Gln) amidotransferase subunit B